MPPSTYAQQLPRPADLAGDEFRAYEHAWSVATNAAIDYLTAHPGDEQAAAEVARMLAWGELCGYGL